MLDYSWHQSGTNLNTEHNNIMSRKLPQPWLRKRGNGTSEWYITVAGRQVYLAPEKTPMSRVKELATAELSKYHLATDSMGETILLKAIMERYLQDVQQNKAKRTFLVRRLYLRKFAEHLQGKGLLETITVAELKKLHITDWMLNEKCAKNTRIIAIRSVMACINWAVDEGYVKAHGIGKFKLGALESRGDESYLPDPLVKQILSVCGRRIYEQVVIALYQSGLRPHELTSLEAQHIDLQSKTWFVDGKTGPRRIALTPQLIEISQEVISKYPTGPVFRTLQGSPFSPPRIQSLFSLLRKRLVKKGLAIPQLVTGYSMRHSCATNLLKAGVPPAIVAAQMGHSVEILFKHYTHIQVGDAHVYLNKVKPLEAERAESVPSVIGVCPDRL